MTPHRITVLGFCLPSCLGLHGALTRSSWPWWF